MKLTYSALKLRTAEERGRERPKLTTTLSGIHMWTSRKDLNWPQHWAEYICGLICGLKDCSHHGAGMQTEHICKQKHYHIKFSKTMQTTFSWISMQTKHIWTWRLQSPWPWDANWTYMQTTKLTFNWISMQTKHMWT